MLRGSMHTRWMPTPIKSSCIGPDSAILAVIQAVAASRAHLPIIEEVKACHFLGLQIQYGYSRPVAFQRPSVNQEAIVEVDQGAKVHMTINHKTRWLRLA